MTMINTIANAHICLLNDLKSTLSLSIRSLSVIAELSPDAINALEKARDGWQAARSQDFPRLLLMTKLVAAGVILEGPELVYELWNVIRRWKRRVVPEHAPSWITLIGLIGWILVSVGVAGEFWVDGKVNSEDENIQSINITLLEDASASASQAKSDASSAHDLAQSASDIAKPAKATADKAKEEADAAGLKVEAVSQKAEYLNKHEMEVEYVLSARFVQDKDGLRDELNKDFKARHIAFKSYSGDREAFMLCDQLADIAGKAGVEVEYSCAKEPLPDLPYSDLFIRAPTIDEALHLSMVLERPGRVVSPSNFGQLEIGPLTVFVGTKASVQLWWPLPEKQSPQKPASSNKSAKP